MIYCFFFLNRILISVKYLFVRYILNVIYNLPESNSEVVAVALSLARDMCNLRHESPSDEAFSSLHGIARATSLPLCQRNGDIEFLSVSIASFLCLY